MSSYPLHITFTRKSSSLQCLLLPVSCASPLHRRCAFRSFFRNRVRGRRPSCSSETSRTRARPPGSDPEIVPIGRIDPDADDRMAICAPTREWPALPGGRESARSQRAADQYRRQLACVAESLTLAWRASQLSPSVFRLNGPPEPKHFAQSA